MSASTSSEVDDLLLGVTALHFPGLQELKRCCDCYCCFRCHYCCPAVPVKFASTIPICTTYAGLYGPLNGFWIAGTGVAAQLLGSVG